MDRFNRLVVVVLLLLALPVCTVTLAIPGEIARLADGMGSVFAVWIGGPGSTLLAAMLNITLAGRVALALAAVLIDLALGVLLFYELRRPIGGLTVRARGSVADVSPESIQAQVMHHVGEVESVLDLDVSVRPMPGGRVELTLNVLIAPDVKVAGKVKEIARVVNQVVKRNMGLRLFGGPIIHVELASPSAMAHADELIRHPLPLEVPVEPVRELGEPAQPALPVAPATAHGSDHTSPAGAASTDVTANESGAPARSEQDLAADGDQSVVN